MSTPDLDVDTLIDDRSIRTIICCGSGGVGKTTTAAAVAIRAAEAGRSVVVLTIDPARRLAQALGLEHLDNDPAAVHTIDTSAGGSLDAMMLDMKRTFDEVVMAHSTPEKAEAIMANPFYTAVSGSFAGTQEYMAMERLGQLHLEKHDNGHPRWDLIVVDTPPSRSAMDFLDAPKKLGSFLDGRFIRLMTAPAKVGGRAYLKVVSVGIGSVTAVMSKIMGAQLLTDMQTFIAAMDTMFGGFRERADHTYAALRDPSTAFLVVASPEKDALREASFFVDRLASEDMPLAGLVVNRVQPVTIPSLSAAKAAETGAVIAASGTGGQEWTPQDTAALLAVHAEAADQASRHRGAVARFTAAHGDIPQVHVPASGADVNDVDQLREIGHALSGR